MRILSPYIPIPYLLRVAFLVGVICATVQAHCVYKPHRFFMSNLFPEMITTRQQFESSLENIGVNEVIELQSKSFQHSLMRSVLEKRQSGEFVSEEDVGFYLFGRSGRWNFSG